MNDVLLSDLLPALDLFVVERRSDSSFALLAPRPAWLTPALAVGADSPFGLVRVFPFLEGFLREAEAFWRDGTGRRLTSDAFAAGDGAEALLLRASALNVGPRCVLVLERLSGTADPRPLLQKAREQALDRERLDRQLSDSRAALSSIAALAARLIDGDLTSAQREVAAGIASAARSPDEGRQPPPRR